MPAMQQHASSRSTERQYLGLQLAGRRLLVPTQDVVGLESADDIAEVATEPGTVGVLEHAGERCAVYALDQRLRPTAERGRERAVVLIRVETSRGPHMLGLCCDGVEVIAEQALAITALPRCMIEHEAWFTHVARLGDAVCCVLDGIGLARLLTR